jgi:hypothetical protein
MRRRLLLAALCVVAVPASAADVPPRKAGLWDVQVSYSPNAPAQSIKQCIDASTDQLMYTTSGRMGRETCSKREVTNSGGQVVVDAVCSIGGKTYTSQTTITGSLDSAYSMKVASKTDAPGGKTTEINITMEGKYVGPCTGDLVAGDFILPGGQKMNVNKMGTAATGESVPGRTGSTKR